ncbi:hypothetical protein DWX43_15085 [Clostridium sp. AF19-22AC]|uniref:hypothetical protein n=1 Tax=Clostridia TaxID=186801 RepID=UPI000E4D3E7E|nr:MULTISPECIES: hypothetical protein [Clostridia]RHR27150.1 hypothetical protein DWX43_15085 [Clostridium sp. AF19-22AC]
MEDEKLKKKSNVKLDIAIILLIILILISIIFPVTFHYIHKSDARWALRHAKNVRLAVTVVAYDYKGNTSDITINRKDRGIAEDAIREVEELSECEGEIDYIIFDSNSFRVKKLVYRENNCLVIYEDTDDESGTWNVYQLNSMIEG